MRNDELGPVGTPFVRGGDIGDGWIDTETNDRIRPEFAHRVQRKLAGPGDVAFITKGSVGRAGRLRHGQPRVVFAPQVAYWRVLDRDVLDSDFLFYFIRGPQFQAALYGVKTHGAMVADYVSISQQHDFRFSFPDVDTQRRIGVILGALDDKIELSRRMSESLEAIARALFRSSFVDFDPVRAKAEGRDTGLTSSVAALFPDALIETELGPAPKGWGVSRLDDVAEFTKGRSYTSEELAPSKTALITLKSFARGGGYRTDGLKPYVGSYKEAQVVQSGEVVVACTDVTQAAEVIGRAALVRESRRFETLVASLDTIVVRPKDGAVSRAFLYFLGRTPAFQQHTFAHTTGTTVLHLSKEALPTFRFILPPDRVLKAFEEIAAPILARVEGIDAETETLAALRDTLLPKLISGELRVGDAERLVT